MCPKYEEGTKVQLLLLEHLLVIDLQTDHVVREETQGLLEKYKNIIVTCHPPK